MADKHTKKQRSKNMAAVKSRGNKSTEVAVVKLFRKNHITGWRRHYDIPGKPDFVFRKQRVAVFLDGCFWHGCKEYDSRPSTNKKFWNKKIDNNIQRDKKINKTLRDKGWTVLRFWEHDIKKDPQKVIQKIEKII